MNKLTPQNAEQEHMVQILLAKMQGVEVEIYERFREEWKWAAKDSDGEVSFYKEEPLIIGRYWCPISDDHALNVLTLNTDGIDWRKSLTRRPEGV